MRVPAVLVALALTACGRLGFGDPGADAGDAGVDALTDAPGDTMIDALDPSLVAWFTFDGSPGEGSADEAGGGAATCVTTCPTLDSGTRGGAYRFDGVENALVVADEARFRLATGTVSLWVRLDAAPPVGVYSFVVGKPFGSASANTYEIYFYTESPGQVRLDGGGDAAFGDYVSTYWTGLIGTWVHVALTWDGQTRLYVSGAMIGETPFLFAADTHPLAIGADLSNTVWERWLDGAIDDLRIYDRALSMAEIAALAQP